MRIKPAGRASECKQQINLPLNRGVLQGNYPLHSKWYLTVCKMVGVG